MIAWFRRILGRTPPGTPAPPPDVDAFVRRQRQHRAEAIDQRRDALRVTRALKESQFIERDLLDRLHGEGAPDDRRH